MIQISGRRSKNATYAQEQVDRILRNPGVISMIEDIRDRWEIDPRIDETEHMELHEKTFMDRFEGLGNSESFRKDIRAILKKFKLNSNWLETINDYIFLDEVDLKSNPRLDPYATIYHFGVPGMGSEDPYSGEPLCSIEINPRTSIEDLKDILKQAQKYFKNNKAKKGKPWGDYFLARDIYILAGFKHTATEIRRILIRKYNKDIDFGYMKNLLSQYHKRFEVPKGSRVKLFTSEKSKI
jgi:hypothetical protein